MVVFHTKDRSRDSLDLYIWVSTLLSWSSSEDQPSTGACLHPDFWLLPALDARHHAHQEHRFDIKGFLSAFSVALPVRSSPSSVPSIEARPRPVVQRERQAGRLRGMSMRTTHREHRLSGPAPPASSAKAVSHTLVHNRSFVLHPAQHYTLSTGRHMERR